MKSSADWAAPDAILPTSITEFSPTSSPWPSRSRRASAGSAADHRPRGRGMHPGMHGTTFGGGPLACAVAIEFLRVLDRHAGHIRQTGDYFHAKLEGLKAKHDGVAGNSRHGPDAGHESGFGRLGRRQWSRNCWNAASSSIAPRTRCCVSCRPTSFRKPTWTWWFARWTRRLPPPSRKSI